VKLRGRHWVALWLMGFLLMAAVVGGGPPPARAPARPRRALQTTRTALEATVAAAGGRVRRARSRAVLVPLVASRLGLRPSQDSEIVILQDRQAR
jgi:hypothetical protein